MIFQLFSTDFTLLMVLIQYFQLVDESFAVFEVLYPFLFSAYVAHDAFSPPGVGPKIRVVRLLLFILNFYAFGIYVKDTSLTHQGDQ